MYKKQIYVQNILYEKSEMVLFVLVWFLNIIGIVLFKYVVFHKYSKDLLEILNIYFWFRESTEILVGIEIFIKLI